MGAGKSRVSHVNNLVTGGYIEGSVKVDSDIEDLDSLAFINGIIGLSKYSESELIEEMGKLGIEVLENPTQGFNMQGKKVDIEPYPETPQNMKHRSASIRVANVVLSELHNLGYLDEKVVLSYSNGLLDGSSRNILGSTYHSYSGRFPDTVQIYASALEVKNPNTTWSMSSTIASRHGASLIPTTLHELGHIVDYAMSKASYKDFSSSIRGLKAVSTYGNSSYAEAFAESFVLYCLGKKPKNGSDYHTNFVSEMKRWGLSSLSGIVNLSKFTSNSSVASKSVSKPVVPKTPSRPLWSDRVPIRSVKSSNVVTTKKPDTGTKSSTPTSTPKSVTATKPATTKTPKPPTSTTTSVRTAKNFVKSPNSVVGYIRGTKFTATLTPGIKSKGYIERTIGSTKYRININDGTFSKV